MATPLVFEKPLGMRDILPEVLQKQRIIERILRQCISRWGYDEIATPALEYFETVGVASATLTDHMFKLLDKQGHTVILRPEVTAPIARVVSSLYKHVPYPIRLFYQANVFRVQEKEAGRPAEFYQTGVELIGDASVDADAEVIALAILCLQDAGVSAFKLTIGHVDVVTGLLEEIIGDQQERQNLEKYLQHRDYVGYRQLVSSLSVTKQEKEKLLFLLQLRGGKEIVRKGMQLLQNSKAVEAMQTISTLWDALEAYGVEEHIQLDLTLIGRFDYYTGIVFEGYAAELGSSLLSGGRYDRLLEQFGRPAAATGFALEVDCLLQVANIEAPCSKKRYVVLYKQDQRAEALRYAQKKRDQQNVVITASWSAEAEHAFRNCKHNHVVIWGGEGP
ncbi:ATP phosphoribosyltransferase regulatory subunit [Brevibacillus laterosporus]|uniref:ATP phosphoribosyltransferase regulatory subunit n=1 Tax=Brevibacillus laterosporus TaxID=1465 RepID=UPI000BD29D60|nr:ATP phosphoribosyltransferase regulatory subunit [Brevibacillus laterosporus]PCN45495.1 ATP phosphoribosyltransferase regulatory subunit [Brevibacillus laterosporus]